MTMKLRFSSSSQFGRPGIFNPFHSHLVLTCFRDEDFARFNQREDEIKAMQTQFKQMQLKLSSMEGAQLELEDQARYGKLSRYYHSAYDTIFSGYRRQIQRLEARLIQMRQLAENSSLEFAEREIAAYADEKGSLTATNERLTEENLILKDEVMELKAMVEVLKNRRGLVSEPRSPVNPEFAIGGPGALESYI